MKNKKTAALLAICLGWLGVHRFYLGQTGKGIRNLIFFPLSFFASIFTGISWLLDSQDSFDNKYNKHSVQREILSAIKEK